MKKYIVLCAVLILSVLFTLNTTATHIYFEYRNVSEISRRVYYERVLQMTERGLRDIHILRVPLDDAYISVAPVRSQQGAGHRQTTSVMLADAGAVGGINADFFRLTSPYAMQQGAAMRDGEVIAANADNNRGGNAFGSFLVDFEGYGFFEYIQIQIHLYHFGRRALVINHLNNVGNVLNEPMAFTHAAMACTTNLDARFPNTVKVVSDGSYVTQVSGRGETVYIPEGGFAIVFPSARYRDTWRYYTGDELRLSITGSVDLAQIDSAVGGAGMLLINGEVAEDGGYVVQGRHPRSAVGVSYCGREAVLMVVDGRGTSVGATHAELAELLLEAGAWNAMHLDGGGSSTMAARQDNRFAVVNTPSDGAQRRVISALGIFDDAVPGEMTDIAINVGAGPFVVGVPITVTVLGQDALGLRFTLDDNAVMSFLSVSADMGTWQDNEYTPLLAGTHLLHVWHNFMWATERVYVTELAELYAPPVSTHVGTRVPLTFSGKTIGGEDMAGLTITDLTVVPQTLGVIENGYFRATEAGTGYIRAAAGRAVTYVPVSVGAMSQPLAMIWSLPVFEGFPEDMGGEAELVPRGAHLVSRLYYELTPAQHTQAAHLIFEPPLAVPFHEDAAPTHLRMQVYGDASGHWLRGRVRDGYGYAHNINFTQNLDFYGWDVVTAQLPQDLPAPLVLERLWLAILSSEYYSSHAVYFYNIHALYAPPPAPDVPEGTRFRDPLLTHAGFEGIPGGFALSSRSAPVTEGTYRFSATGNTALVRLSANANGLDERQQWTWLARDAANYDLRHIIIRINRNPQTFPRQVYDMFHGMMREFAAQGRTVLVVFPGADNLRITDGVRYISTARISVFTDGDDRLWWYGG